MTRWGASRFVPQRFEFALSPIDLALRDRDEGSLLVDDSTALGAASAALGAAFTALGARLTALGTELTAPLEESTAPPVPRASSEACASA